MSEFLAVLDELDKGEINREFLERLSGVSRREAPLFAERLARLPEVRRLEIVAGMAYYANEDFALDFNELFRACLGDESALVRRQAVEGLWEDERPDLAPRLVELLRGDPSPEVRAAAAEGLGRFVFLAECEELDEARANEIRLALELCIRSAQEPVQVRRRAVESIAFINDDAVRRIIDSAYADENLQMRQSAVFAMGRNADPFWAETVHAELSSDMPAMRYEAVRAAGNMGLRQAVPTLIRLIHNERDEEIQLMAVWALGQIGGKRAEQALQRLTEGDNVALAEAAEEALEELSIHDPSFDLMYIDLEGQGLVEQDIKDAEYDQESEEARAFLRQFERYTDEDDDSDQDEPDDEDWPDEFLEIG